MRATHAALERFLSRLLLRSSLDEEERATILSLPFSEATHRAHRDFVQPGQVTDFSCLVAEGVAGRFDQLANGHRSITALHIPGDMCDLHSAAMPYAGWGIEALCDTHMLLIPHKALRDAAVRYPAVAFAFWRDSVADGSVLSKWLASLGRRSARERLAHLVCEIGLRMEHAGLGTRDHFQLRITQAQLADVLGLTAVHLNRSLQALRNAGLLFTDGREFRIKDVAALRSLAEFDPEYLVIYGGDRVLGRSDGGR